MDASTTSLPGKKPRSLTRRASMPSMSLPVVNMREGKPPGLDTSGEEEEAPRKTVLFEFERVSSLPCGKTDAFGLDAPADAEGGAAAGKTHGLRCAPYPKHLRFRRNPKPRNLDTPNLKPRNPNPNPTPRNPKP